MKTLLTVLLTGVSTLVQAQTFTHEYQWSPTNTISDGNPVGMVHQFAVTEATEGSIYNVQVSLNISGGCNGDLYAYLISPQGIGSILLNRVGVTAGNPLGYADTGFNIMLDGLATQNVHGYQGVSYTLDGEGRLTGTWAADGRNIVPTADPALFDSAATTANLGQYAGRAGNGTWTLLLADMSVGEVSTLNEAVLTITTIPEPQTGMMLAGGLAALLVALRRKRLPSR
jgi:subtilisin-like proprotein convertase family protein